VDKVYPEVEAYLKEKRKSLGDDNIELIASKE